MQRPRLTMLMLGLSLIGSTLAGALFLARQMNEADADWQLTALAKWGSPPTPGPELLAIVKPYDYVAFSYGVWDSGPMQAFAADARKQNLDIHLGTYFAMHEAALWCKADADRGGTSWGARWWRAVSPYLARGADGDTASVFRDQYVWNVLLPEARAEAIKQLRLYVEATGITWAMLDFVSVPLDLGQPAQIDLDGDSIGQLDDPGERAALTAAWFAYVRELRAAMPSGFLLVANGDLALRDPAFSALLDGCYVEGFPLWRYGSQGANYTNALDPAFGVQSLPGLCAPGRWARIPGLVMIEDRQATGNFGMIAALFDGCVELRRPMSDAAWPSAPVNLLYLGQPTAAAVPGWSRVFENGMLHVVANGQAVRCSVDTD